MPIPKAVSTKIHVHFATLSDPRRRKITHPLINFIVIAICAVICGAEDFIAIADFGRKKRRWFRKILDIDGETLRGSFDKASNKSAIRMISAWASANSISLGKLVVDAKSNEITAILKLLERSQLKGATVTIDAAGCQTEIARRIVDAGGHYVLNVKGNQGTLRDGIEKVFAEYLDGQMPTVPVRHRHSTDKGHGGKESRWHDVCGVPPGLPDSDRWPGFKASGMVIRNTERDGKECFNIRYDTLSKKCRSRLSPRLSRVIRRSRTTCTGNRM